MGQQVNLVSKSIFEFSMRDVAKANLNRVFIVYKIRPETKWSSRSQAELAWNMVGWRAELVYVALYWDELRLGVKGQSNLVIAGTPRNLFR